MSCKISKTPLERPSNTEDYSPYDNNGEIWTLEKLKDRLYVHLMSIKIHGERRYERQALKCCGRGKRKRYFDQKTGSLKQELGREN